MKIKPDQIVVFFFTMIKDKFFIILPLLTTLLLISIVYSSVYSMNVYISNEAKPTQDNIHSLLDLS